MVKSFAKSIGNIVQVLKKFCITRNYSPQLHEPPWMVLEELWILCTYVKAYIVWMHHLLVPQSWHYMVELQSKKKYTVFIWKLAFKCNKLRNYFVFYWIPSQWPFADLSLFYHKLATALDFFCYPKNWLWIPCNILFS